MKVKGCWHIYEMEMWDKDYFNEEVQAYIQVDKNGTGVEHKFHFTVRHLGDRVGIESFEIKDGHPGGYEFSIIGDIDNEIFKLFGKLFERMRRALSRKHLQRSDTTNSWRISKGNVVRAKIDSNLESNDDYGHQPLIVIDGKEIKWDEFGRMLMTYEGFNFKLEIFDRSDEIHWASFL